jgi:hypothetical protein
LFSFSSAVYLWVAGNKHLGAFMRVDLLQVVPGAFFFRDRPLDKDPFLASLSSQPHPASSGSLAEIVGIHARHDCIGLRGGGHLRLVDFCEWLW